MRKDERVDGLPNEEIVFYTLADGSRLGVRDSFRGVDSSLLEPMTYSAKPMSRFAEWMNHSAK